MNGISCVKSVILDLLSIFLVYLPWIILQTLQPFKRGFYCNDESLKYPYHPSTIPGPVATALGILIPIIIVISFEAIHVYQQHKLGTTPKKYKFGRYRFHSYWLICYKIIGIFFFGAAAQQTITNIGKYSIGRLRPHFFDVCQPDYSAFNCTDERGLYVYITEDVCTNTDAHRLKEMRLSFPSGHSSLTSYCAVYLVLYLQHRMTWKGSILARPFIQMVAIWLSVATCVSRIRDNKHHCGDVILGVVNGVTVALIAGFYIAQFFKQPDFRIIEEHVEAMVQHVNIGDSSRSENNEPAALVTLQNVREIPADT